VTWAIPAVPGMRVLCPSWGQIDGFFRGPDRSRAAARRGPGRL